MPPNVILAPQAGSQVQFVTCPAREVLYEGTRGPGKTLALLMDFLQHVGQGHGAHWRGILFRQTYPQLADVIAKSKEWFWRVFPAADYNKAEHVWTFPAGETLSFRHMDNPDDYWGYHGHEYPFIAWEEVVSWATPECYDSMKSCNRSSHHGMPRKYRATCNPWGAGHGWVKERFIDPAPACTAIVDPKGGWTRVRIHGDVTENKILTSADPEYIATLEGIEDENLRKAWRYGDWDIAAGGIFTDVWDPKSHIVEPFAIPAGWEISRSFDWGSSRPFSVGWWALANGEQPKDCKRTIARGTWVRIGEWYGWNGKANQGCHMLAAEVARGILEREAQMGIKPREGVADSAIFDNGSGLSNESIATTMERIGVKWTPANKGPGSRAQGWEKMREHFVAAKQNPMEKPGLIVFDSCRQFIRTVPTLLRDDKKPDDVNCFVAGTMISTPSGEVAIQSIRAGDLVCTPIGPRRVVASYVSGRSATVTARFSNGRTLEGTSNHRVFVAGAGLVELGRLKCGLELLGKTIDLPVWELASYTTGLPTISRRGDSTTPHRGASSPRAIPRSIDKYGSTAMGQSQTGCTSTILTATTTTVIHQTCESSARRSTRGYITEKESHPLERGLRSGEKAQRARGRSLRMAGRCEREHRPENLRALIVQRLLLRDRQFPAAALGNVPPLTSSRETLGRAKSAENPSHGRRPHTEQRGPVVINVAGNSGEKDVYNITVESAHLFYANGVLVTNTEMEDHCGDDVRYRIMTTIPRAGAVKLATGV